MSTLSKVSLVTSVFLMFTALFYATQSVAKTSLALNNQSKQSFASTVPKPIAGRNRRNIALSTSNGGYPRALNDQIIVASRTNKLRINVLANDSGSWLKIKEVNKQSSKGGRVFVQGRHVVYLPKQGFRGWDSFWYAVIDSRGRRHSAKVNICLCDR